MTGRPDPEAVWRLLAAEDRAAVDAGCALLGPPERDAVTKAILGSVSRARLGGIRIQPAGWMHRRIKTRHRLRVLIAALRAGGLAGLDQLMLPWSSAPGDDGSLAALTELKELTILYPDTLRDLRPISGLTGLRSLGVLGPRRLASLRGIETLRELNSLSMVGSRWLEDISALSALRDLVEVDLDRCPRVRSLAPLAASTGLRRLSLANCGQVDLTPLSGSRALVYLDLSNTYIDDSAPLRGMPRLSQPRAAGSRSRRYDRFDWTGFYSEGRGFDEIEYLSLRGRWELPDLGPLERAPQLRALDLTGCYRLRAPWPLMLLPKLELLDLERCSGLSVQPEAETLEGRGEVDAYRRSLAAALEEKSDRTADEERWLAAARRMRLFDPPSDPERDRRARAILDLLGGPDIDDARQGFELLELLGDRAMMRSLAWGIRVQSDGTLQPLARQRRAFRNGRRIWAALYLLRLSGGLDGVQKIAVRSKERLEDLTPLAGVRDLEVLQIMKAPTLSDLAPLASCPRLRELTIHEARQLLDLSPLAGCARLESLELGWCPATQLSPLGALRRLQRLHLTGNRGLQPRDLAPLGALPALEVLDLNHCSGLPRRLRRRHVGRDAVISALERAG